MRVSYYKHGFKRFPILIPSIFYKSRKMIFILNFILYSIIKTVVVVHVEFVDIPLFVGCGKNVSNTVFVVNVRIPDYPDGVSGNIRIPCRLI